MEGTTKPKAFALRSFKQKFADTLVAAIRPSLRAWHLTAFLLS